MSQAEHPYAELAKRFGLRESRGANAAPLDLAVVSPWAVEKLAVEPPGADVESAPDQVGTTLRSADRDLQRPVTAELDPDRPGSADDGTSAVALYLAGVPIQEIGQRSGLATPQLIRELLLALLDIEVSVQLATAIAMSSIGRASLLPQIEAEFRSGQTIEEIGRPRYLSNAAVGWLLISAPSRPLVESPTLRVSGQQRVDVERASARQAAAIDAPEPIVAPRVAGPMAGQIKSAYFAGASLDDLIALSDMGRARLARVLLPLLTGVEAGFRASLPGDEAIELLEDGVGADLIQDLRRGVPLAVSAEERGLPIEEAAWFLVARGERLLTHSITPRVNPAPALRPQTSSSIGDSVVTHLVGMPATTEPRKWTLSRDLADIEREVVAGFQRGMELEEIAGAVGLSAKAALGVLLEVLLGVDRGDVQWLKPIESRRFLIASGSDAIAMFERGAEIDEIAATMDTRPAMVAWAIIADPSARRRF